MKKTKKKVPITNLIILYSTLFVLLVVISQMNQLQQRKNQGQTLHIAQVQEVEEKEGQLVVAVAPLVDESLINRVPLDGNEAQVLNVDNELKLTHVGTNQTISARFLLDSEAQPDFTAESWLEEGAIIMFNLEEVTANQVEYPVSEIIVLF